MTERTKRITFTATLFAVPAAIGLTVGGWLAGFIVGVVLAAIYGAACFITDACADDASGESGRPRL